MHKLLLLGLVGFALIAISGAEEEKEQQIQQIEEIENREVREAEEKKHREIKRRKSGGKSGRNSVKKSGRKSEKKSGRKSEKKSGRKSERKSGRKSAKKAVKTTRRKTAKKVKTEKAGYAATCLAISCIDTAAGHLKLLNGKVANFDKQNSRIEKQSKTGSSKSGKKGIFGSVVRRIVENGGGNASNLTCNGQSNSGARQLTNLTQTLLNCEDEIKKNCDPSTFPHPNITEVTACNNAIDIFKNKTSECLKSSGSDACTCWSDSSLETAAKTIRSCDLSKDAKLFANALKTCTATFGKCRKYEDAVGIALHACNQDTAGLVKKLKNLSQNKKALGNLKTKLDSAASQRSVGDASSRTCAAVATMSSTVISLVTQNPVSYSIFTLIQSVISVNFTCTQTEKEALKAVSASVDEAITMVALEVSHIQTTLILLTGSAASDTDIEAEEICKTEDDCDSAISVESPSPLVTTQSTSAPSTPSTSGEITVSSPSTSGETPVSSPVTSGETPTSMPPSTSAETPVDMLSSPSTSGETSTSMPPSASGETPVDMLSSPSTSGETPVEMLSSPSTSGETPVEMLSSPSTSGETPVEILSSPTTNHGTPQIMTTGAATRRARRFVQDLLRKRMVQTLV